MGLDHPDKLLGFNLTQFWKRNLVFLDVDRSKLERWRKRKQRREDSTDRRYANFMLRFGQKEDGSFSMQSLVDGVGRGSFLVEISLEGENTKSCAKVNEIGVKRQDYQGVAGDFGFSQIT